VFALHDDLLVVVDRVEAPGGSAPAGERHDIDLLWHIDPRWEVSLDGAAARLRHIAGALHDPIDLVQAASQTIHTEMFHGDEATHLGWHSPVYGRLEPCTTLRTRMQAVAPVWMASVFGFDAANQVLQAELVPVFYEAGAVAHAVGLRISRARSVDYVLMVEPTDSSRRGQAGKTWRLAGIDTDARLLFCRIESKPSIRSLALVDASVVRLPDARLLLARQTLVSDLHLDGPALERIAMTH
jgi:hypothetical protein